MTIGVARAIFENINASNDTDEAKGLAIRMVLDMATHNSVTKREMLNVIDWMWNKIFEFENEEEGDTECG